MNDRTQFIDLMPFEDLEPFSAEETEALAEHNQELRNIWNDASSFIPETKAKEMNDTSSNPTRSAPHHRDVEAGRTLCRLRLERGMSQTAVAQKVGISFQQIQKYEIGSNRMSVSRLCQLGEALNVHPSVFFEDMSFGVQSETDDLSLQSEQVTDCIEQITDPVSKAKFIKRIMKLAGKELP
jgi:transcriptional regulator with XRE-family HTH domain